MTLISRLRGIRKRWWVLIGVPAALVMVAGIFLLVKWVQYRAYQNVDLVAILPDDVQSAVRVKDLRKRWPELRKAPGLVALARTRNPSRGAGPLSMAEAAELLGGSMPEGFDEPRALEALGRDVAAAMDYTAGKQDVVAATRVPFSYFLAAPFIRKATPPDVFLEFRGEILIVGTRADWVQTAAARADSGESGRIAVELETAAPEGDPAFWVDVAAARADRKLGPRLRENFNSVPVREALFMLDLDAARAVSGRLVTEGPVVRLEGTVLLSQRLDARLARMYEMPDGDPGLAAMLPANTCYATGAKADPDTSWGFVKDLTKPQKGSARRKTVSEGFGDFVSNVYLYLHDGMESAEEHKSAADFRAMFDRDIAFALTAEKEEPFVGLTLLARVRDGKMAMDKLYDYFVWLNEDPDPKSPKPLFTIEPVAWDGLDVRVLRGQYEMLGKGALPAFTVINNVLVLSSSFETLKQIADVTLKGAPGFAGSPTGSLVRAAAPSDGPAWAYANIRTLRESLYTMRSVAARMQVERETEATGAGRVRQQVTEEMKKKWQREHAGEAWKENEHITEIDAAYREHQAQEELRVAQDMDSFSARLNPVAGMAFVVRQGKGDTLEWRAVLASEQAP